MVNIFPIQFLALFAYLILRLFVGGILLQLGITHWAERKSLGAALTRSWWPYGMTSAVLLAVAELVLAALFITGTLTQVAALATALMSIKLTIVRPWFSHETLPSRLFYCLLLGCALSLFITGAGAVAVDLPL